MKSRRGLVIRTVLSSSFGIACALGLSGTPMAQAQAPAPGSGGAAGVPPVVSGSPPPTSALPALPVLTGQLGEAHVTIVGGNVASARERAFTEAFRHAVDTSLSALLPDVRAAQPKVVIQVLGRARSFIRRYRTLEEGELVHGSYAVKIDAEVDEGALRRAFDRALTGPMAVAGSAPSASYLLVGTGTSEAVDVVSRKLAASGARVLRASAADAEVPARLLESAARAQVGAVAFVSATATAEGRVRGLGLESVTCSLSLRVVLAGTGLPQSEESEVSRSFALQENLARGDCFERAAAAVVGRSLPAANEIRDAPDTRNVIIDADVVEPAAVLAMLNQLRGLAVVSAVDVRRVVAGRVELRVRSRLPGAALVAMLARDSVVLDWLAAEATGDLVKARVRLSVSHAAPAGGVPPPPPGNALPPAPGAGTP